MDDLSVVTTLSGLTVPHPAKSVLVKYTWSGDANLDGVVNGSDYALADTGFASGGNKWSVGDFNYDGIVNGSDYGLLDTGFAGQSGTLPEPWSVGLAGLLGVSLLRRCRRMS